MTSIETTWSDEESLQYHLQQWSNPKYSTIAFAEFANDYLMTSRRVIDLACGAGGPTSYLANLYSEVFFEGLDFDVSLIETAKLFSKSRGQHNLNFFQGDWLNLEDDFLGEYDGVISLQTLSWMENLESPLMQIFQRIKPNWIGVSSLFYEGDISCEVKVLEHERNRVSYYNTYSLKEVNRVANKAGYGIANFKKFEIPVDLPPAINVDRMSTFTLNCSSQEFTARLQISGPLLMNWYFVILKKFESPK